MIISTIAVCLRRGFVRVTSRADDTGKEDKETKEKPKPGLHEELVFPLEPRVAQEVEQAKKNGGENPRALRRSPQGENIQ